MTKDFGHFLIERGRKTSFFLSFAEFIKINNRIIEEKVIPKFHFYKFTIKFIELIMIIICKIVKKFIESQFLSLKKP